MSSQTNMTGKVCLVTGATNGIGKETARALAKMGATVLLHARDEPRGRQTLEEIRAESGNSDLRLFVADLASLEQVRKLAAEVRAHTKRLDVLINNAGVILQKRQASAEGYELTFAVNHLAHFLLTRELLDLLEASAPARIVNVSSGAHHMGRIDFDDLQSERSYGAMRAYGQSKLANVLFTRELARRLDPAKVTANAVHPGGVATGFALNNPSWLGKAWKMLHPFLLTAEKGARTSIYLASSPEMAGVTGKYFVKSKPAYTSKAARDDTSARMLWEVSERLVAAPAQAR